MITLRKTSASRRRISNTVAIEMIFSARLKADVWSTEMAALPVSWPRNPDPARKASVSDRSALTAAFGPCSPGCPCMLTSMSCIFWFFAMNSGEVLTERTDSMCALSSAVASASTFCRSAAVRTELSDAPTAMMPEAEATDGNSSSATVWACVDWYDVGSP